MLKSLPCKFSFMSSNNPQQPAKNYQYASTTPSVSSLLNLPQVQDKKKPVAAGLAGLAANTSKPGTVRTTAALGLAPTKQPLGTLKLKKPEATIKEVITEETKAPIVQEIKAPITTVEVKTHVTKESKAPNATLTVKPSVAKVVKPKTEKHSSTQAPQSTQNPNDHFDPLHWRLFVGNLGPEVTDSLLLNTFKNAYPSTSKVLIVRDWKTQKSKGYAFVAFADGKEFLRALKEMNGKWIGNRQCIIKKSEHQPKFQ